ncbi:MAG TPA: hypothetical protein VD846_07080 [Allosphingosinicella sp.]|nr:hypothetical protein [Allosphingosinicella sp.]
MDKKTKKKSKRIRNVILYLTLVSQAVVGIDQIVGHGVHLFQLVSGLVQGAQLPSH